MVRARKPIVDYPLLGRRTHYINPITGARLVSTRGGSWSIIGDTIAPVAAEAVKKGLIDIPLWALKNIVLQPAISGLKNYALPFLKKNAFSIAKFLAPSIAWKYGVPAVKWGYENTSAKQKLGAAAAAAAAASTPVVSKIKEMFSSLAPASTTSTPPSSDYVPPKSKSKRARKPKVIPVIEVKTKTARKKSSRSRRK